MPTTVSGNIKNLATAAVGSSQNALVRFILKGTGESQPVITGTGAVAPTSANGIWYTDLAADANGAVSGTIYSTRDATGLLAGDITVSGSGTAVYYDMQIVANGMSGPSVSVHAKNGATLDPSSVTPITTPPVVSAPTGDGTYLRLTGDTVTGLTTFLGGLSAKKFESVRFADQFTGSDIGAKVNAAVADLGTNGKIIIPAGSYSYSTAIVLANGITLEGDGPAATVLSYTGSGTAITGNFLTRCFVKNLGLTLSNASAVGIKTGGTHCGIEGIYITGTCAKGIWATGDGVSAQSFTTFIRNCELNGCTGTSLAIDHAVDVYVTDTHLFAPQASTTAQPLVIDTGVSGVYFKDVVTGWGKNGVLIQHSMAGAGVYGAAPIYLNFWGMYADGSTGGDNWLFDSTLSTNSVHANLVNCWGGSAGWGASSITTAGSNAIKIAGGNTITVIGFRGLRAAGNGAFISSANVSAVKFMGCNFLACNQDNAADQHGIYVTAAAADVQIIGNRIGNAGISGGNQKYGLKINAIASALMIANNDLNNNVTDGLLNNDTNVNSWIWGNVPTTCTNNIPNTLVQFISGADATSTIRFGGGSASEQALQFIWQGKSGDVWNTFKQTDNSLVLARDIANGRTLIATTTPGASSSMQMPFGSTIGGGSLLARYSRYTPSLSPSSVAANTTAEQTFTNVLTSGDVVVGVSKPTAQAGLGIVGWRASGTSLLITFSNNTGGSITPTASETYQVIAVQ